MQDNSLSDSSAEQVSSEASVQGHGPRLQVQASQSFNLAAWQNSVPLLKELAIDNSAGGTLSGLVVEFKASPAFAREKRWIVDRVTAGDMLALRNIDLDIDPDYLNRLDEAERGVLTFQLTHKGELIHETSHNVRVLARDEWGGIPTMADLLPAFVTPNDPALPAILRAASSLLGQQGHATSLEGYQSQDATRVYMLSAAIWSAISARQLIYANPPGSFERVGQKVRRVSTVLSDGLGTCLDLTLLFASTLEAIGLHPVLVLTQGHCFVGVWLIEKTFPNPVVEDCVELRKAIAAREMLVFETTLVTKTPAVQFPQAVDCATASVAIEKEHEFVAVVDVKRGRMRDIRPLASHIARKEAEIVEDDAGCLSLPPPPGFDSLPATEQEERPQTPEGRIERWQRKLLDLSLRNRLLNFVDSKQTIPLFCTNVSRLEDILATGNRLRLVSLVEANPHGQRDSRLHHQRTQKDLDTEFAKQALDREELVSPLSQSVLNLRLTTLYRKVQNDLSEGGSNTLYLAVGFLRWKQKPDDEKSYSAPLLLVPVKLIRRSASSPFHLASHEDDGRFNATLLQMLKKDFDCDITSFESDLPMDDSGVDVPRVFERMRRAVRDIPGFEVVEEAVIATFSFAKYLMWKDLVDRVGQLKLNRVIRHLIENPDKPFVGATGGAMPRPADIDTRYHPGDIVHPLPADSSQLAAVMAASEGHDFVIVGPPGTGKSQTIANLIAQCLAIGKTVLFVAEKTAALNVVHRRLKEHGLGDCCVELHSNKAERRRFLDQLESSWRNRSAAAPGEWESINSQLCVRRDQLNEYATALHHIEPNGWTAYRAMGEFLRGRSKSIPQLGWPKTVRHNRQEFETLRQTVADLASAFQAISTDAGLPRLKTSDWSMAWESSLLSCCQELAADADRLRLAIESLSRVLNLPTLTDGSPTQVTQICNFSRELIRVQLPTPEILQNTQLDSLKSALATRQILLRQSDAASTALNEAISGFRTELRLPSLPEVPPEKRRKLYRLANHLTTPNLPPTEVVFHKDFSTLQKALVERREVLQARDLALQTLQARLFSPTLIDRIPIGALERDWNAACRTLWPVSIWKKRDVQRKLQAYMAPGGVAEPEVDFPLLREYAVTREGLTSNLTALGLSGLLRSAVERDVSALDTPMQDADRLRDAFSAAGVPLDAFTEASDAVLKSLVDAAKRLYPPGREAEALRQRLQENLATLGLSPSLQEAVESNASGLDEQITVASSVQKLASSFVSPAQDLPAVLQSIIDSPEKSRIEAAREVCIAAKGFFNSWKAYNVLAGMTPARADSPTALVDSAAQAQRILERRRMLKLWTAWLEVRRRAEQLGLSPFIDALSAGTLRSADAVSEFTLAYAQWWLPHVVDGSDPIRGFQRYRHEEAIESFRQLDAAARKAAPSRVQFVIRHGLPSSDEVARKSELGLLRHQMSLKRPSKAIREVIGGMPETFNKLAPCLLMSPLSIAQYLPVEQSLFDVVVFDEASQIATWDAVGAIARGKQTIIVGDPKQLPPTNFFGKSEDDESNVELADHEKDLESILDETRASGLPTIQLNWHYRSRHESLIAFSNYHYYGNQLITFPSAESEDRGVSFRHVANAIYDRGKSRTNRLEAEAIVANLVDRMRRSLRTPEEKRLTYGVVTFNRQQQELIQDLFDAKQREFPELDWFFSEDRIEPTMVKNLENVQGDERDVMMFSITFGFDAAGKFPIDFGAINRDGGERRLNVAVTRARQELVVFASFLPDQLRAERSSALGVRHLKTFLEYAQKGPRAIFEQHVGSQGDHESPFEEAVAAALRERGWRVDAQVGVSGFRVDLGIIHPDKPGAYLAGVECDGATYHRSATARDRDKTRQIVLENLGWKILRVWSTDWFYDSETAIQTIDRALNDLLEQTRLSKVGVDDLSSATPNGDQTSTSSQDEANRHVQHSDPPLPIATLIEERVEDNAEPESLFARIAPSTGRLLYQRVEIKGATTSQEEFVSDSYSETLKKIALEVINTSGPIREDALAREVSRAHGFPRSNSKIRQRILDLLTDVPFTDEGVGRFLWPAAPTEKMRAFRYPPSEEERRSLDEIAMPELLGLVHEHSSRLSFNDPATVLAREIGLARLSRSARERLEQAIELYAEYQDGLGGTNPSKDG